MAGAKLVALVEQRRPRLDMRGIAADVEQAGLRFRYGLCASDEEILAVCRDADGIIASWVGLSKSVIDRLEQCQVIVVSHIGVDRVDVVACTEAGIMVSNLPEFARLEVRNHTMALLLALNRRLPLSDRIVRSGQWGAWLVQPLETLYGQTLGLVGFGNIGRMVAPVVQAFGMNVSVHDPYVDVAVATEYRVGFVSLEELLRTADYVSLHVPLNEETRHMLTEAHFRLMKPTAFFINTSRGPVVDERALCKALQEKWIAGAGLDVLEKEPPDRENPLLGLDSVILSPHSAGSSRVNNFRAARQATEECIAVLNGRYPRWLVNPFCPEDVRERARS